MTILIIISLITIALILYCNVRLNEQIKLSEFKEFKDLQKTIKLQKYLNDAYKDITKEADITLEHITKMRLKHRMDENE